MDFMSYYVYACCLLWPIITVADIVKEGRLAGFSSPHPGPGRDAQIALVVYSTISCLYFLLIPDGYAETDGEGLFALLMAAGLMPVVFMTPFMVLFVLGELLGTIVDRIVEAWQRLGR